VIRQCITDVVYHYRVVQKDNTSRKQEEHHGRNHFMVNSPDLFKLEIKEILKAILNNKND